MSLAFRCAVQLDPGTSPDPRVSQIEFLACSLLAIAQELPSRLITVLAAASMFCDRFSGA